MRSSFRAAPVCHPVLPTWLKEKRRERLSATAPPADEALFAKLRCHRLALRGGEIVEREALGLQAGSEMEVRLAGRQMILEPVGATSASDRLYGKHCDVDLLANLEHEHRQELDDEPAVRS